MKEKIKEKLDKEKRKEIKLTTQKLVINDTQCRQWNEKEGKRKTEKDAEKKKRNEKM